MRRAIVLLAVMAATVVAYAGAALAQTAAYEALDANTLNMPQSSTAYGFFPGTYQAQTFTAKHNGDITRAEVKIHVDSAFPSVDGVKASINTVDAATDYPTSNVLASTTIPSSDIPVRDTNVDPSSIPLTTLTFENPPRVEAGKQYAILLHGIAPPNTPIYVVRWTTVLGDYAGGQGMWVDDFGHFAGYLPGSADQVFAIYVTTTDPDTTAPTTTATLSPQPNEAGWNNSDVTVSLSATDDGSGVEKIAYSASGAQTIEQTDAPGSSVDIMLDQEGTATLTYYATDKAGNVEDPKTLTVKIDRTPPTVLSTKPPKYATGVAATANISAKLSDSGSGIASDILTTDNFIVEQVSPRGNVPVVGDVSYDQGSQTITFDPSKDLAKGLYQVTLTGVKDNAGNVMPDYIWTFTTAGPPKR